MTRPFVLVDPWPRNAAMLFTDDTNARLARVADHHAYWDEGRMPGEQVEAHLPQTTIIVGQTHLDVARIARAERLKAVINVKGNWEPHIDYAALAARGVHVLSIAPCMAPAVAEWCLGALIDLARGISAADRAFRAGNEAYGIKGNGDALTLFDQPIGLLGFGNLGRALLPLLRPFGGDILVHDPWLPDGYLHDFGLHPVALDTLLAESQFLLLLAGVTSDNAGFLDAARIDTIRRDACVVLASRAEIIDVPHLIAGAETRALRLAIDVFPQEPVPQDTAWRRAEHPLWSAHREGGVPASYRRLAHWMMDDIEQILQGLPPVRLQRAEPSLAAKMRSR